VLVLATQGKPRGRVHERLAEDFSLVTKQTFTEAREQLSKQRFVLVLVDYREPGLSPDAIAREFRTLDGELSVIALSEDKVVRVLGEHSLLVPFDSPDLITLIYYEIEIALRRQGRTAVMREMEGIIDLLKRELQSKETLAAHGVASASMVHDIKNALLATLGYTARLIQETEHLTTRVGDQAKPIDTLVKKLEQNSNYLLHLAHTCRLQEGAPIRRVVNLRSEIEHVHSVLFFQSPLIHINNGGEDLQILGDRYELHRVFLNLFKNAFEAEAKEVRVTLEATSGHAVIHIADNGKGFAREDVEAALHQHLRSSKRGGQGLGLRICRQVIERHGGTLALSSSPRLGAVFTLSIPLATK